MQFDETISNANLSARYTDMHLTGKAIQCDEWLCEILNKKIDFRSHVPIQEMSNHRYVFDVDGNSYSARFRTHLLSHQTVLKSTVYSEWYSERIQPWVHYIPIRVDYTDLHNVMAFFSGGLDEARTGNHDELAKQIAEDGRQWAETMWRHVDMQVYFYRLLLEYSRALGKSLNI